MYVLKNTGSFYLWYVYMIYLIHSMHLLFQQKKKVLGLNKKHFFLWVNTQKNDTTVINQTL